MVEFVRDALLCMESDMIGLTNFASRTKGCWPKATIIPCSAAGVLS